MKRRCRYIEASWATAQSRTGIKEEMGLYISGTTGQISSSKKRLAADVKLRVAIKHELPENIVLGPPESLDAARANLCFFKGTIS